ncbi:MAG: hypothetical protein Q6352_002735 [Candidatus Freyrarchaeum guaymaensis]|nr:hypothetical protein [Candidatus Sigynarchaeota archaeon]
MLQTIEETIIQTVMNNRNLFEKFVADTNEIRSSVQQQIIEKLRSIPCPYMHRKVFEFTCQVNSNKFKTSMKNFRRPLAEGASWVCFREPSEGGCPCWFRG